MVQNGLGRAEEETVQRKVAADTDIVPVRDRLGEGRSTSSPHEDGVRPCAAHGGGEARRRPWTERAEKSPAARKPSNTMRRGGVKKALKQSGESWTASGSPPESRPPQPRPGVRPSAGADLAQ